MLVGQFWMTQGAWVACILAISKKKPKNIPLSDHLYRENDEDNFEEDGDYFTVLWMCLNGDTVGGRTVISKLNSENENLRRLDEIQVSGNKYVCRAGQLVNQLFVISRSSIELYGGSFIFEGTSWMYVMEDNDSVSLNEQGKDIDELARLVHDLRRTMRGGLSRRSGVDIKGLVIERVPREAWGMLVALLPNELKAGNTQLAGLLTIIGTSCNWNLLNIKKNKIQATVSDSIRLLKDPEDDTESKARVTLECRQEIGPSFLGMTSDVLRSARDESEERHSESTQFHSRLNRGPLLRPDGAPTLNQPPRRYLLLLRFVDAESPRRYLLA